MFNITVVLNASFSSNDRLARIIKHGSLLGYLSSWPYLYHYGVFSSIWFTTPSQSCRNLSSGRDVNKHVTHEQKSETVVSVSVLLISFYCFYRILWMVPIYSLDSVSCVLHNQNFRGTSVLTELQVLCEMPPLSVIALCFPSGLHWSTPA